jgi:hypothetical protein
MYSLFPALGQAFSMHNRINSGYRGIDLLDQIGLRLQPQGFETGIGRLAAFGARTMIRCQSCSFIQKEERRVVTGAIP